MTTEPTKADETITDLVNERINLENELAPLTARLDEINKHLRNLEPGKYQAGPFDLTISESKRFDKKRFEQDFPAETNAHLYKTIPERQELATDRISKAVKDTYSTQYDNRITIK